MVTGVACGLQNRYGAFARPGWVRFPHVPASFNCLLVGFLVLVAGRSDLLAQVPPDSVAVSDTTEIVEPEAIDRSAVQDTTPPITPLGALGRSMILPGWGQLEVGRPGRGAFYFVAEATFLYMVFKSNAKLSAAKRAEPERIDLISARTRQRENWIVLAGFIAFMSGLDAWVSTHMWDFEPAIGPPDDETIGVALRVPVRFP